MQKPFEIEEVFARLIPSFSTEPSAPGADDSRAKLIAPAPEPKDGHAARMRAISLSICAASMPPSRPRTASS